MPAVKVSAIVVNHRREDLLATCLESLTEALASTPGDAELVVIDNGSGDGSPRDVVRRCRGARLVELPENMGFATAAAEGVRQSKGDWVLLLNDDATIEPDGVSRLLAAGERADSIGSVAAQIRFADRPGVINSAGIEVDRLGVGYDRLVGEPVTASEPEATEVFGASGGAALYRRAMLEDVGGLDESFFVYLEDLDLAWRARMRGWRCVYEPRAVVYHHHSATTRHGSAFKYFHVGLNRVRVLAKNVEGRHLRRYALGMIAYDVGYVAFAAVADRTLAPVRGRVRGLREWRSYRRAAGSRRPVELAPVRGLRAALARRAAWRS